MPAQAQEKNSPSTSVPFTGRRLVPRKEAMWKLGVGRQKWHELVQAGRIPVSQVGGRIFIQSDKLDALIEHPERLNGPAVAE